MKNVSLLICSALLVFGFLNKSHAQTEIITTYAGTGTASYTGDGGQCATATLSGPAMLNTDGSGNIYICDNSNNRVRKINPTTGVISLVAGDGTTGTGGDGSAATAAGVQFGAGGFGGPGVAGVAVDASGNVYISDGTNNKIRKVDGVTGIISTYAGTGTAGALGDGAAASAAQLNQPRGLAIDGSGNLYIADATNNKVRKIVLSTGIITTVAGTGTAGATGDGAAATLALLSSPRGVCTDAAGNIYIADRSNNKVRMVTLSTGFISTYAGSGTGGFAGDGGAAATAQINRPVDVKMDASGDLFIADNSNARVRMVNGAGNISTVAGAGGFGGFAGDGGPATAAAVRVGPASMVLIDVNHFFISDQNNNRIRYVKPNSKPYFFTGSSPLSLVVCENTIGDSLNALLAVMDSDKLQTLTWSVVTTASHGTLGGATTAATTGLTVTPHGLYYTPTVGYSGTDNFVIKVKDGYDSAITTVNVTVNPLPVVAALAGPNTVCVGSNITLTDATGGGAWTTVLGNASVVGGTVTGVTAGIDTIKYAVTNACGTTKVIQPVTVNPLPDAGTITGAPFTVCVAAFITLTDAAPGGTWSASNGNATVVGGFVTGVSVGTDDISYTVTTPTCGTANAIQTVTINTVPTVPPITGLASVCVGSSVVLADGTPGGAWSASNGNATVVSGTVSGVVAGTDDISYAVTNGCGTTTVVQTETINPLPVAGAISGAVSVCIAGTIGLSETVGGGVWSTSNANATVSGGGVVTGVTVGACVISYSVTNVCGTAVATYPITIISVPSAGTISGPSAVCVGATIPLTDGVLGGSWTASNANATVSAGGVVTGVTAGTVVITYTIVVSCGTDFTTYPVTVNPLPNPGTITGTMSVCVGSTTTLADAVSGGTWSSGTPAIGTIAGGVVAGIAAGVATISYSVTNGCGTLPAIANVTVNPIVIPSVTFTATPGFNTCPGTSVTYTALPVNGGSTPVYEWRVNGTVIGGGASVIHTPLNGDVFICKMTSNAACAVPSIVHDTVRVVVNPTLTPAVNISTGAYGDTVCLGTMTTYSATPVNGGTTPSYQWYINGTPAGGGNPYSYIPSNGDHITCALTSSYVCPSPATVMSNTVTMKVDITEVPAVTITVSPGNSVCVGTPVTFTAHPLYGGVPPFFRWTQNGINVATGVNYIYLPSNGDNVYCMMASSASCRTLDSVFSNHIHMTAITPSVISVTIHATATNISVGMADTLTAVVTGAALFPTYQWYKNGTAIPGAINSTYVVTGTVTGTALINCVVGSGDACNTSAVSNILSLTFDNVGVQQVSSVNSDLKLLPNPNKGIFTMNLLSANDEQVHVVITNILGEKVKEFTTSANIDTEINLVHAAGIYFLNATTGHNRYTAKVIVE